VHRQSCASGAHAHRLFKANIGPNLISVASPLIVTLYRSGAFSNSSLYRDSSASIICLMMISCSLRWQHLSLMSARYICSQEYPRSPCILMRLFFVIRLRHLGISAPQRPASLLVFNYGLLLRKETQAQLSGHAVKVLQDHPLWPLLPSSSSPLRP
jgi:hypothetical protein